jgi:hypothetical protein
LGKLLIKTTVVGFVSVMGCGLGRRIWLLKEWEGEADREWTPEGWIWRHLEGPTGGLMDCGTEGWEGGGVGQGEKLLLKRLCPPS